MLNINKIEEQNELKNVNQMSKEEIESSTSSTDKKVELP